MSTQAIAGVSPSSEAVVMIEYPSVSAGGVGQLLGSLYESIPLPFGLPKLSYIFALMTAPLGILLYFFHKVFGKRYVLTNRGVQVWTALTNVKVASVALEKVSEVELDQQPGQVFYNAANLRLKGDNGETLLKLSGVKDAVAFQHTVERTIEARKSVAESMARIEARA